MLWQDPSVTLMFQRDGTAILENVSLTGAELPGCQGRLQNPGKPRNKQQKQNKQNSAMVSLVYQSKC